MKVFPRHLSLLSLGLFLISLNVSAAGASTDSSAISSTKQVKGKATSPEVQRLVQEFNAQREVQLSEHAALMQKLQKATTADERRQLLTQSRDQLLSAQKNQAKRVRDDLKKLREAKKAP